MTEKQIEQKLVKRVKGLGGIALKLNPIGMDGIPDRLILLPKGIAFFVETKAPGKKPRALQINRMKQLEHLLNPIGMDGIPDRLILLPKGIAFFVETKAPGKKPRALQINRMKQLEHFGFHCYVLDDDKQIDEVIENGIRSS